MARVNPSAGAARSILLSTLFVVAVAMCLVAVGDYNGYEGPVALETISEHDAVSGCLCVCLLVAVT